MLKKIGIVFFAVIFVISMIVFAFIAELGGLHWDMFFAPKKANVERMVFEETKSFKHGKIQDLAKYYEEYTKADAGDVEPIRQLIIMNFSDFDSSSIDNQVLRNFLINQRGY